MQNAFGLLVWTRLTRDQRNYLTGRLPDALIALTGGAGTLSEIGLARQAGRPVVFLDSFDDLRKAFRGRKEAVHAIFREIEDVFRRTRPRGGSALLSATCWKGKRRRTGS